MNTRREVKYAWTTCSITGDFDWDKPPDDSGEWEMLSLSVSHYPSAVILWKRVAVQERQCPLPPGRQWVLQGLDIAVLDRLLSVLRETGEIHIRSLCQIPSLAELVLDELARRKKKGKETK